MPQKLHEFTQYIAPDGAIYRFETGMDKFLISETGLGMPPIRYITTKSPTQHGETVIDYRLEPRVIQLVHVNKACSRQDYWDRRAALLNMIRPNRDGITSFNEGTLRKIFQDGSKRDINVLIEQGPEFAARNSSRWSEWTITETLRFIAHDPLFFDPDQKSVDATLATSGFVFPFSLPLIIEDDTINLTVACTTEGTEDTFPTIVLTGPMSGIVIENETLGLEIKLVYNISINETVTIYLQPGSKRVISSYVGDITGTAYYTSDLATFRLAPHPKASGGENTIRLRGSGVVGAGPTAMSFQWYDRYIGI